MFDEKVQQIGHLTLSNAQFVALFRRKYAIIVGMNQSGTNEIQELHAEVRGQVQGIGFRYFVVQKALMLGLRGYTRNESNGGVEVVAQGPKPALERLLALLRQGPSAASVSEVRTSWRQPTEHFSGFHVRW
ncbi:MAG TPA: acylphosphatase [Ktedonobacteraceae bacterium]|nr:acylphosphatase [Ktedonobacteraceae bacterium]